MKHLLITVLLLGSFIFSTKSQDYSIKGIVKDSNYKNMNFYNATLRNASDSSMVKGGCFIEGNFIFDKLESKDYILEFSCLGYESETINISMDSKSQDVGVIILKMSELDEVIVMAKAPTYKVKEGITIVNVQQTNLKKLSNVSNVLRLTPGLILDHNSNITVMGKGSPIIIINDRPIRSNSELEALRPSDLINVEVIKNPSAEYEASGKCVVRITTKKLTSDQYSVNVMNNSNFGRDYQNTSSVNASIKKGTVSSYVSYSFYSGIAINKFDIKEVNHTNKYKIYNFKKTKRRYDKDLHSLFGSFLWAPGKKSTFGIQYALRVDDTDNRFSTDQKIVKCGDIVNRNNLEKSKNDNVMNTVNVNYELKIDSDKKINILSDYSYKDISRSGFIKERKSISFTNNENDYKVYGFQMDYRGPFIFGSKLLFGVKFSGVENNGLSELSKKIEILNRIYRKNYKVEDNIYSAYFNISKRIERWKFNLGLRSEQTSTKSICNDIKIKNEDYLEFFPSLSVYREISDKLNFNLSYTRKIDRPIFRELSTERVYIDSLSYRVGNPLINPSFYQTLELNIGFLKGYNFVIGYQKEKDMRITSGLNDDNNPDIIRYTPVNVKKSESFYLNLSKNFITKFSSHYINLYASKPKAEVPYLNSVIKMDKPSFSIQAQNNFNLSKRSSLSVASYYSNKSEYLMTKSEDRLMVGMGFNTSFFKEKLHLSIWVNDIFNTSDLNYEDRYGNLYIYEKPDYDFTSVSITLRYDLNANNLRHRKRNSNKDMMNRL